MFFGFVFKSILEGFWNDFWKYFRSFLDVMFDTFQDFAEKVEPHESIAHTVWIVGRAGPKTIKKH